MFTLKYRHYEYKQHNRISSTCKHTSHIFRIRRQTRLHHSNRVATVQPNSTTRKYFTSRHFVLEIDTSKLDTLCVFLLVSHNLYSISTAKQSNFTQKKDENVSPNNISKWLAGPGEQKTSKY